MSKRANDAAAMLTNEFIVGDKVCPSRDTMIIGVTTPGTVLQCTQQRVLVQWASLRDVYWYDADSLELVT